MNQYEAILYENDHQKVVEAVQGRFLANKRYNYKIVFNNDFAVFQVTVEDPLDTILIEYDFSRSSKIYNWLCSVINEDPHIAFRGNAEWWVPVSIHYSYFTHII